jgi:DNA-directed RNA polymerase subunit alpha
MSTVALPKKIDIQTGDNPNQAKIVIEPCFPGYGVTIGNSLRRVLLSSLPGAAVVGVKIQGVSHEFMALPHLKEDILEFILNLKQLRLKVFSDEIVKLELEVHGKKDITASDIKKDSNVEIVNPDLVIGHIVDMAGSLNAEIYVSKGMGYEMIENRERKEKEIGYIEMDSVFSPIMAVGVNLENVRVGKQTNYDKLTLDIKTDGTITPKEAFETSVAILIEQFNSLLKQPEAPEEDTEEKPEENGEMAEETEALATEEPATGAEEGEDADKKKRRGRPKKTE